MELQSRFLGKVVPFKEIKQGDLYLVEEVKTSRLIFVIKNGSDLGGVILNEWGASNSTEYPDLTYNLHYHQGRGFVRRIDGDVGVEPLQANTLAAFSPAEGSLLNGTLCASDDGRFVMLVRFDNHSLYYDLATGEPVKPVREAPYVVRQRWRLVWRDGDEAITLCELGPKAK